MSPVATAPRRTGTARARATSDRPIRDRARASARQPAPRLPRRLSGPLGGRAGVAHAPREAMPLGGRALALVRGLPDHSLIDRLVRGRAWIPVLGVLLAGIVTMQVEILKLGTSMGRAMEQSTALQTTNESLQANLATLADDQRIERLAAAMGMSMPSPASLVFRTAHPNGDVGRALANIHAPDPTGFASELAAEAAAAAALMPSSPATTSTGSTTQTSSTGTDTTSQTTASTTVPSSGTGATATSTPATSTQSTTPPTQTAPATTTTQASPVTPTAPTSSSTQTDTSGAATVAPSTSSQSGGG